MTHVIKTNKRLRIYRVLIVLSGILGFILVLWGAIIPVLWPVENQTHLISSAMDAFISQFCLILGGATLQTSLIGWLFKRYSELKNDISEETKHVIDEEGLLDVFQNSSVPEFTSFLCEVIRKAKYKIVISGLGNGFLRSNTTIHDAIRDSIKSNHKLEVKVLFAMKENSGLLCRLEEELGYYKANDLSYSGSWPTEFYDYVSTFLPKGLNKREQKRLKIEHTKYFPTIQLIEIDNLRLISFYGSPSQKGRESPWMLFDTSKSNGSVNKFLKEYHPFMSN